MNWSLPIFSSKRKPESNPILEIGNKVPHKYKLHFLVGYKPENDINQTYMAIITELVDTTESNTLFNKYNINIIDIDWPEQYKEKTNVEERHLVELVQPEYKSLNIDIDTSQPKNEQMIQFKKAINSLNENIDFINNADANAFSDIAKPEKEKLLSNLKLELNKLMMVPNSMTTSYTPNEDKLYGKMKITITNLCKLYELNTELTDFIIKQYIKCSNRLFGFTGTVFGLNVIYYYVFRKQLLLDVLSLVPDEFRESFKQPLLTLLYLFVFNEKKYLYNLCTDPRTTLKAGSDVFFSLFRNDIILLSNGEESTELTRTDGRILTNIPPVVTRIDDGNGNDDGNDDDDGNNEFFNKASQDYDFEQKGCITFNDDIATFNDEQKVIFNELNDTLNEFNNITLDNGKIKYLTNQKKGGKRNKKTRKINKKRRVVRKTKKTNKSYKKNKKHNTKKRNTKRR